MDVAHLGYITATQNPVLIELAIQIFHCFSKKIKSQVFPKVKTLRSVSSFKSSNSMQFLYFGSFFFPLSSESQRLKKGERIFRMIEFPTHAGLIIKFSIIWPNLTEINQIIVEL